MKRLGEIQAFSNKTMNNKNDLPTHLFFELIDETDLYVLVLEPERNGSQEQSWQSYSFEQVLKDSLKTLTPAEKTAAKAKIAKSMKRFLKTLES